MVKGTLKHDSSEIQLSLLAKGVLWISLPPVLSELLLKFSFMLILFEFNMKASSPRRFWVDFRAHDRVESSRWPPIENGLFDVSTFKFLFFTKLKNYYWFSNACFWCF
jgi:hypothetical protein